MAEIEIPDDVRMLLERAIDSVEQLSVLLLLHADPARVWTTHELTQELRSTETSVANRLEGLYGRNVLTLVPELEGRHTYSPSSLEIGSTIDRLREVNRIRPYRVIDLIYGTPSSGSRFSESS